MSDTKITKIAPPSAAANPQTRNTALGRPTGGLPVAPPSARSCQPTAHSVSKELDQFYTHPTIAWRLYQLFKEHFDPEAYLMVEPSAGKGAFFVMLPERKKGYDLKPQCPGVEIADFLDVEFDAPREEVVVIGNPPFGKNASLAVCFFNHAAWQSSVIAFIVPRSFKKASIENRLDRAFHLICEVEVPKYAFLFDGQPYGVPCVFQIWERRDTKRAPQPTRTTHPDFAFTTPDRADFAIQRIGARAGQIHHDLTKSASSHLFVKSLRSEKVEEIMRKIDFTSVKYNTVGNPSVAKCEIVSLYEEQDRAPQMKTSKVRLRRLGRLSSRRSLKRRLKSSSRMRW